MPERMTVLEEATVLVGGARAKLYGAPNVNLRRIARAAAAYGFLVEDSRGVTHEPTEFDVTQFMILLKVVRQADGYHRDSTIDTAGYAWLAELVSEDEAMERYEREVLDS